MTADGEYARCRGRVVSRFFVEGGWTRSDEVQFAASSEQN